jgi:cytochrome c oxidase subunit 2
LAAAAASLPLVGVARAFAQAAEPATTVLSSIFAPVSLPAAKIRDLAELVLWICAAIFVITIGALVYCIVRFRARPGDEKREPPQIYGSNQVEIAWTVLPLLIVLVLFLATARTIGELELRHPPLGALQVTVVGHRWWWEFQYPEYGITTANELHIPVSTGARPRPTFLALESADVVHSFWVPQLAGKTDVIPNRRNTMWIDPSVAGLFLGQCAEYCGMQHANMLLRVYVHSEEEFARWVAAQQAPDVVSASAAAGRALFERTSCVNCHTLGGTVAEGTFGPSLSHLMSRDTIGSGVASNTPENLRSWLANPQVLKPGCRMPDMKLTPEEVDQLVAYLVTLH